MSDFVGLSDREREKEYGDLYWDQCGFKDLEEWKYNYDLLSYKVDTLNEMIQGKKTLEIQYIFDDNDIPKFKRIKLLNDMINSLSVEIGEATANGRFPELKEMFDKV